MSYLIQVENSNEVDFNEDEFIEDTGYLEDDITNGLFTTIRYVPSKKEVKEIVKHIEKRDTSADIYVYELVELHTETLKRK